MSKPALRTYYLAGPMTGIEEFNYPEFNEIARLLRKNHGLDIVSPAEQGFVQNNDDDYEEIFEKCRAMIYACTDIVLLPGWSKSRGAKAEFGIAMGAGLTPHAFLWLNNNNPDLQKMYQFLEIS